MMRLVRIGDVCEVVSGATPRRDNPAFWNGTVPWVTPKELADLDGPRIGQTAEQITEAGFKSCSTRMLPPGAVLFSSRAPIGHVAIATISMCTNQGFKSLVPNSNVDSAYLYWVMKWSTPTIEARASGTTFKEVSKAEIEDVKIPLPPLSEQRRIAAILDEADALRRKRREALGLLDALLRSAFLEMFGDPVTNPRGWETVRLDTLIVDGPSNGLYRPSTDYGSGTPIVRIDSFYDGRIEHLAALKRVRIDADLIDRFAILEDDVLINRVNSPEHLGKAALVPALSEPTVFESNMMRLRLDSARTDAGFMVAQLLTPHVKRQIATASKDAINQSSINQTDVRAFQVRLPPLHLQGRWRAFAAEHRAQAALWSKAGEVVDQGFNSLLDRAFASSL